MATWSIAALRTILATETDADSPGSEELLSQLRENWEALTMLAFDTGITTTSTTIAETVWTDSGSPFANVAVGMTLLITSGTAIGNMYTIDATNSTTTVTCTGDTLVSDGVQTTDTAKVMFDLKVNADGHDHDGINSKYLSIHQNTTLITDELSAADVDTSYTTLHTQWHYHTGAMNSCIVQGLGQKTVAEPEADFQITYGAATGTGAINSDSYGTVVTGTMDISGEAAGWKLIDIALKSNSGSGNTVYLKSMTLVTY